MRKELNKMNNIIFIVFSIVIGLVFVGYLYRFIFLYKTTISDLTLVNYIRLFAVLLSIAGFILTYFLKQYKIPMIITLSLLILLIFLESVIKSIDGFYLGIALLFVIVGVSIMINRIGLGLVIGSALSILIILIKVFTSYGFEISQLFIYLYDEFYPSLCLLIFGILILCKKGKILKKLWFLPLVVFMISMILYSIYTSIEYGDGFSFMNMLLCCSYRAPLIEIASFGVIAFALANYQLFSNNNKIVSSSTTNDVNSSVNSMNISGVSTSNSSIDNIVNLKVDEYYHNLGLFFVLLVFTAGIYTYYWIYKTTKLTNEAKGFDKREETSRLLLCMFIPFYVIFWAYETSKRIDGMLQEEGKSGDLTGISVILMIFIPIVYYMMAQNKINELFTKK